MTSRPISEPHLIQSIQSESDAIRYRYGICVYHIFVYISDCSFF